MESIEEVKCIKEHQMSVLRGGFNKMAFGGSKQFNLLDELIYINNGILPEE